MTAEHIQNAVNLIGTENLGFDASDVGNHSVCSSFAMFLILNKVPPEIVQIQGRWKSKAFMDYIRPQVTDFSNGLSEIMLRGSDFFTAPEEQSEINKIRLEFRP